MAYNETRTQATVGTCPACQDELKVVVAIALEPIEIAGGFGDQVKVGGKVVGAKSIEHDCLPRPTRRGA